MEEQEYMVGIGELEVHHNPAILRAIGLGSCVGVALYDKEAHIGGLAHVMLPQSSEFAGKIDDDRKKNRLQRYSDIAIPIMVSEMEKLGAKKKNIRAKIAGGARMFVQAANDYLNIGDRNIEAVKRVLKENQIPIDAEDTGGNVGRSLIFEIATQKLSIKTIKGQKEL